MSQGLNIAPAATFVAAVRIHVPGGGDVPVNFTFLHKGKTAIKAYIERAKTIDDLDAVAEIVAGWEGVEAEFSREALGQLLDAYPTAAVSILEGYLGEIGKAAAKN